MKRLLTWGGLALIAFIVATRPSEASDGVVSLAGGILDAANGFATFFTNLFT